MESNINWQSRYNELQEACMKERAALQAKCERYKALFQAVHQKAKEGIFPHLPVETMGAQKCVEIDAVLNEALSAGEGEKGNLPEGWPHACHVCGKQDCESDHK